MYGQIKSSVVLGLLVLPIAADGTGTGEQPIYRGIASPSSLNFLSYPSHKLPKKFI